MTTNKKSVTDTIPIEEELKVNISLLSPDLINKLYNTISDKKLSITNVTIITASLMQIVQKYDVVNGYEKKAIILHVLKKLIDETIDDKEEKTSLLIFIDLFLPSVIDTIKSVDIKEIYIKNQKHLKKFFFCC
jgi:hypothetical protein